MASYHESCLIFFECSNWNCHFFKSNSIHEGRLLRSGSTWPPPPSRRICPSRSKVDWASGFRPRSVETRRSASLLRQPMTSIISEWRLMHLQPAGKQQSWNYSPQLVEGSPKVLEILLTAKDTFMMLRQSTEIFSHENLFFLISLPILWFWFDICGSY